MAQLFVSGPCWLYVGVGLSAGTPADVSQTGQITPGTPPARNYTPVFLGTCVVKPDIRLKPYERPLKTDDSGDASDDVMFMGEEALIFAEINWYDESVYSRISARPRFGPGRGRVTARDVGTLYLRSGNTYPLWVVFSYAGKTIFGGNPIVNALSPAVSLQALPLPNGAAATPMPPGYRFPHARLVGDDLSRLGSRERRIALVWHALEAPLRRGTVTQSSSSAPLANRVLYDHDMSGLPRPAQGGGYTPDLRPSGGYHPEVRK